MKTRPDVDMEGEIGDVRVVEDFLPPPDRLVLKDDAVTVTQANRRDGAASFEVRAAEQDVACPRMIRALVDGSDERSGK